MASRQRDIPVWQLIELKRKGLKDTEIAKVLNCTQQNVTGRLKKADIALKGFDYFDKNEDKVLQWVKYQLINSLSDADIKSMAPRDRIWSYGVLYDKYRLQTDQSTANINYNALFATLSEVNKLLLSKTKDITDT